MGAANRTTLADYENALQSASAALLSVRWSESGSQIAFQEIADLARRKQVPLIADLGAAPLIDLKEYGVAAPAISEAIKSHADVVIFATDGLLGGPSGGAIVGKKSMIDNLRKHPLYRTLAANSIMLAALLETLQHYREKSQALERIPALALLSTSVANLEFRAQRIAEQLKTSSLLEAAEVAQQTAPLGGVGNSSQVIPTFCVKILPKKSAKEILESHLTTGQSGLLVRSHNEYLCIDLRSVMADQDSRLVEIVEAISADS